MAPWDELRYFDLPIETQIPAPINAGQQLIGADPRRVYLAFSLNFSNAATISLVGSGTNNQGHPLNATNTTWELFHATHGNLVHQAFFAQNTGAGCILTVTSVTLHAWPTKGKRGVYGLPSVSVNGGAMSVNRYRANTGAGRTRFSETLRRLWNALPGLRSDSD